jgi:hypothetical protein
MSERFLTSGEMALLQPIFVDTLPYKEQIIGDNFAKWGGSSNSITAHNIPRFSPLLWTYDFSRAPDSHQWIFIHEMTHAWQWYHGENNVLSAVKLWTRYGSNYDDAYDYNFDDGDSLFDFNFEQQACIVADYWFVSKGLVAQNAKGMRAALRDYLPYITELRASGPPRGNPWSYRGHNKDYELRTMF